MTELYLRKRDLLMEAQRCTELFNSQVFTNHQILTQSAFIEILVRLNYILQELSKKKGRIVWADDVQTDQNIRDITDLVNNLRNAACHIDSPRNYIEYWVILQSIRPKVASYNDLTVPDRFYRKHS